MAHKSGERTTDEFAPSAELLTFPVLALADPVRGRFAGGGIGWGKVCSDITVVVPLARFTAKSDGGPCSTSICVAHGGDDAWCRSTIHTYNTCTYGSYRIFMVYLHVPS